MTSFISKTDPKGLIFPLMLFCILIGGCASKRLIRSEAGDLIRANQDIQRTVSPARTEVSLSLNSQSLYVQLASVTDIKTQWTDVYQKIGVYEIQDFRHDHLFRNWSLKFDPPYESKELLKNSEKLEINSSESSARSPIQVESIRLTVGNTVRTSSAKDGMAIFRMKDLNLDSNNLPENLSMSIEFADQKIDLSDEYSELASSEDRKIREREASLARDKIQNLKDACSSGSVNSCLSLVKDDTYEAEYALEKLCERDYKKSCEDLHAKFPKMAGQDVAAFLHHSNLSPFKKNLIYQAMSLRVVQKIPGGYLVTPNIPGEYAVFGMAFLKTTQKIQVNSSFCSWITYSKQFDYISTFSAPRTVPEFKIYREPVARNKLGCMATPLLAN